MSEQENQKELREKFRSLINSFQPNRTELAAAMKIDPSFFAESRFRQMKISAERLVGARKYFLEKLNFDIRDVFTFLPEDFPEGMEVAERNVDYSENSYRTKYEQALEREVYMIMKKMEVFDKMNQNLLAQNDLLNQLLSKLSK